MAFLKWLRCREWGGRAARRVCMGTAAAAAAAAAGSENSKMRAAAMKQEAICTSGLGCPGDLHCLRLRRCIQLLAVCMGLQE